MSIIFRNSQTKTSTNHVLAKWGLPVLREHIKQREAEKFYIRPAPVMVVGARRTYITSFYRVIPTEQAQRDKRGTMAAYQQANHDTAWRKIHKFTQQPAIPQLATILMGSRTTNTLVQLPITGAIMSIKSGPHEVETSSLPVLSRGHDPQKHHPTGGFLLGDP